MNWQVGDVVKCPPNGPHAGPRIGKIIRVDKNTFGKVCEPVLVKYIDYPEEMFGWLDDLGAYVHPLINRKLI